MLQKKTINVGNTCTIKLLNNSKSVKWSTTNKKIKITKKSKKSATIKGVKNGTSYLKAKVGKKTYKCKITILKKPQLDKTNLSLKTGNVVTVKILNAKGTVKWSKSDNKIKIEKSTNSYAKIKAVNSGTTYLQAKYLGKTYKCKIIIQNSAPVAGSRTNPLSAYNEYTTNIYDYGRYLGKFKIQLLDYKDGKEAWNYLSKYEYNDAPTSSREYIYVRFKITYLSGSDQIDATDVVNHYSNFFNSNANYQLDNLDWASDPEDIEDMVNISLYPGGNAICSTAILICSGNTPITYRLETKDSYGEDSYTWFTTKK